MQNLLKLTDRELSLLRQAVMNECGRRTRMAVEGRDAGAVIYGNELAKRSMLVAAAGGHSLLLLGPSNCGKTMLRAAALALGLEEVLEARSCPAAILGRRTRASAHARRRRSRAIAATSPSPKSTSRSAGRNPATSTGNLPGHRWRICNGKWSERLTASKSLRRYWKPHRTCCEFPSANWASTRPQKRRSVRWPAPLRRSTGGPKSIQPISARRSTTGRSWQMLGPASGVSRAEVPAGAPPERRCYKTGEPTDGQQLYRVFGPRQPAYGT